MPICAPFECFKGSAKQIKMKTHKSDTNQLTHITNIRNKHQPPTSTATGEQKRRGDGRQCLLVEKRRGRCPKNRRNQNGELFLIRQETEPVQTFSAIYHVISETQTKLTANLELHYNMQGQQIKRTIPYLNSYHLRTRKKANHAKEQKALAPRQNCPPP